MLHGSKRCGRGCARFSGSPRGQMAVSSGDTYVDVALALKAQVRCGCLPLNLAILGDAEGLASERPGSRSPALRGSASLSFYTRVLSPKVFPPTFSCELLTQTSIQREHCSLLEPGGPGLAKGNSGLADHQKSPEMKRKRQSGEILTLVNKNSCILEVIPEETAFVLLLLLNLCMSPRLHFFPSAELFYFFCQCQLPPRCQDVPLQSTQQMAPEVFLPHGTMQEWGQGRGPRPTHIGPWAQPGSWRQSRPLAREALSRESRLERPPHREGRNWNRIAPWLPEQVSFLTMEEDRGDSAH
eukprot:bmy_02832T0